MRILFDHGPPGTLIPFLAKHTVTKARDAGFDLLMTTGRNMRYRQNLSGRIISIVVLGNSQWRIAVNYVEAITASVDDSKPGSYAEIDIPKPPKKPFTCS